MAPRGDKFLTSANSSQAARAQRAVRTPKMASLSMLIPGMSPWGGVENMAYQIDSPESERVPAGITPEARVLIVMTGGTICMEKSEYGLIPARNFLERCMAPRPEFNEGTIQDDVEVRVQIDGSILSKNIRSLRTPLSSYGKRVRYTTRLTPCSCTSSTGC